MKVVKPSLIRDRVREYAAAFAGQPVETGVQEKIASTIIDGVGLLFPQTREGKIITSGKSIKQLGVDLRERVRWNASLLLGYLFADENAPFTGLDFDQLSPGHWQGLGRWAGFVGDAPKREGFPMECVWLANRGMWAYVYMKRFYTKPVFGLVLVEMERAYGSDGPSIVIEPGGMVDTSIRLQAEPLPVTEATFKELIGRWRLGDLDAVTGAEG